MIRDLSRLEVETFDLLVIGGGITGACLACDAAGRGMRVALVEKGDFGSATSSASSKLLHGGIRYLQQARFRKVRESAMERIHFQNLAPHLIRHIPFLVPTRQGLRKGKALLQSGMAAYQALCLGQNRHLRDPGGTIPGWRFAEKDEISGFYPGIDQRGLTGGVLFYESHMQNSERMTLAFIDTAVRLGGVAANYVRVESFILRHGQVLGVKATDLMGNQELEIRAQVTANAAGPWIPALNRDLGIRSRGGIVTGYSKGAHIITRSITRQHAVALTTTGKNEAILHRGGRHLFIIPWRNHSLIGTTYGPYGGDLDEIKPLEEDVDELVADLNQAAGNPVLGRADVCHAWAGIYPLVSDDIRTDVYQGTGNYQVVDHRLSDGVAGLVTVFGAKYVTARLLAEKALDVIAGQMSRRFGPCLMKDMALAAGRIGNIRDFRRRKYVEYESLWPEETVDHLITHHGTYIDRLAGRVRQRPDLAARLASGYPVTAAEVVHAVEDEMACRLDDVLFRRTGLGTLGFPGEQALSRCAELMGGVLGWSKATRGAEISRSREKFFDFRSEHSGETREVE
jgi:glycerol-3-phosphate dehydrogenase